MPSKTAPAFDAWMDAHLAKVLPHAPAAAPETPRPQDLLPPGEEMVPATLADLLERYVTLLGERQRLTVRQRAYDADLAKLQATGTMLVPEWQALDAAQDACLADLHACTAPTEEVVREMWKLCQHYLRALLRREYYGSEPKPRALQLFLEHYYHGTRP